MTIENRMHRRKLVNAKVLLIHPDLGQYQTYTHDISNGGVFVLLQDQPNLPLGTRLDMRFLNSEKDDIVFKMEVAHFTKLGLGLKFLGYELKGKFHEIDALRKQWHKQAEK